MSEVKAQDITDSGGTLTVFEENGGGSTAAEGSPKVIDGDVSTKFLSRFPDLQWMQFQLNTPAVVRMYTLTTGNDAPDRDPKDWTFEGSLNGTDWTVLDTRTDRALGDRLNTIAYEFDNDVAYKYYRLYITALNGSSTFQLGEWRLLGEIPVDPDESPSDLSGVSVAGNEVILSWADNSILETGFHLERSTDGTTFDLLADLPHETAAYTDLDLTPGTSVHYRVKAYNSFGETGYSNVFQVTTLDLSGGLADITDDGGILTVSNENSNENENSPKLIDNNSGTKYLIPVVPPFSFRYESVSSANVVTNYTFLSANDAASRDPKDWTFEGSDDGENWTVLDTRIDESFDNRLQERTFIFPNTQPYKYYKVDVTANHGASISQIGEWQIFGISQNAPAIPRDLTVTEVESGFVSLKWTDAANNETGYEIWRASDATNYRIAGAVEANATTFTDSNVRVLKTYIYKVRAIADPGNSLYSDTVSADIPYDTNLPFPASDLTATVLSDTSVSLTWTDNADNENGYDIERSVDGENFTVIHTTAANVTTYTDATALLATRYFYRVRPFNDYSQSSDNEVPYSLVKEVITTGVNQAPTMAEIADQSVCNYQDELTITIEGLTPGPEKYQDLSLAVTTDNDSLFKELLISNAENGIATLSYSLQEGITGEANIKVTVTDDGGTLNGGANTFIRKFVISAYELEATITADYETEKVERGQIIKLEVSGESDYHYEWAEGPGILSDRSSDSLIIKPNQNYIYTVLATTEGCFKEFEFLVQMEGSPYKVEPNNILTPNNDRMNDTWIVWNINLYPGSEVKVFDLEGRIVFQQKDYNNDWEGTSRGSKLSSGTYYYIINLGSGIPMEKGTLTIIQP